MVSIQKEAVVALMRAEKKLQIKNIGDLQNLLAGRVGSQRTSQVKIRDLPPRTAGHWEQSFPCQPLVKQRHQQQQADRQATDREETSAIFAAGH